MLMFFLLLRRYIRKTNKAEPGDRGKQSQGVPCWSGSVDGAAVVEKRLGAHTWVLTPAGSSQTCPSQREPVLWLDDTCGSYGARHNHQGTLKRQSLLLANPGG